MLREAKKSEKNIIESRNNFPTLAAAVTASTSAAP
jgi:hypothetical protein